MTAELLARSGGIVAGGGLALLLVGGRGVVRLVGLSLWAVGLALLVPLLIPDGHTSLLAAGVPALVIAAAALAVLFRRFPWALAFLALAAAPARVPVSVGGESANLLIPLYVVVVGAAVALGWSLWRDEPRARELGLASWPLALFVLWVGTSAVWAGEPKEAAVQLFFFVLPFGLLALAIARLPWKEASLGWLGRLFLAMALVFGAVGIWQWASKDIFWNEKVMRGNENHEFFRVNSLFWDPSIYGRFLVLAILVGLVVMLSARRVPVRLLIAVVVVLWVGLVFSFSQSSFAALLVGLALLALLTWGRRAAVALAGLVLLALVVGLLSPQLERVRDKLTEPSSESVNRATGGRFDLVSDGIRIAVEHPLLGVGAGNFTTAYEERFDTPGKLRTPASHTTPVTVAAETGIIGLALFAWLLVAALVLAFGSRGSADSMVRTVGLVAGVGLVAVIVHSLVYSGFLEDPIAWGLIGLAALVASQVERELATRARGPSARGSVQA